MQTTYYAVYNNILSTEHNSFFFNTAQNIILNIYNITLLLTF